MSPTTTTDEHAATAARPDAPPPGSAADSNARRGAIGLGVVLVAQLMLVLDATVVNVALPHIQADLGFTPAGLSWVLNAYTLAFGGLLLLGGRLGDVFGRLRIFEIGLAVFTVASLLGGLATSPAWLIAARTLQGAGAAMAAPSVLALVTTSARNEAARNRGLALFTAVSSAGASIGPLLGAGPPHPARPRRRPRFFSAGPSPTASAGTGRSSSTCPSARSCSCSPAASSPRHRGSAV